MRVNLKNSLFILAFSTISLATAMAASTSVPPPSGQCAHLDLDASKIIPNTIFPVTLKPYGDVCFVGHIINDPLGDEGINHQALDTAYIALSLYQNGKDIHDLTWPNTPDYAWNTLTAEVKSVAFRRLRGSKYTDIIVIGVSGGPSGQPIYQPLIYITSKTKITFDQTLSDLMSQGNYATMPALLKAIDRVGVKPPPASDE
ncbi:hypothetical protein [Acidocella facilis]|uniref:hypothetical protein n=1 Tax=Acidocella facilis TaxID=525 RepID=UPI0012DC9591|nr:hypothetical protein [Acidocella facilis]